MNLVWFSMTDWFINVDIYQPVLIESSTQQLAFKLLFLSTCLHDTHRRDLDSFICHSKKKKVGLRVDDFIFVSSRKNCVESDTKANQRVGERWRDPQWITTQSVGHSMRSWETGRISCPNATRNKYKTQERLQEIKIQTKEFVSFCVAEMTRSIPTFLAQRFVCSIVFL